jgi:outer membrane immunogenic protein
MKSPRLTFLRLAAATTVGLGVTSASAEGIADRRNGTPHTVPASWTGFYVGAHVGSAWANTKITDADGYNEDLETFPLSADGFFGGAHLGYSWRSGNFVFGIEAALGGMDLTGNKVQPGSVELAGGDTAASFRGGTYGDVTARAGFLIGARSLVYAKGGLAFVNGNASVVDNCDTPPCGGDLLDARRHETLTGWVLGGGIEHQLSSNWNVKIEYLHFDFGSLTVDDGFFRYRFDDVTADAVRLGFNYRLTGY